MTLKELRNLLKKDMNRYIPIPDDIGRGQMLKLMFGLILKDEIFPMNFWLRLAQFSETKRGFWKIPRLIVKCIYRHIKHKYGIQIPPFATIGGGLGFVITLVLLLQAGL